MTNLEFAGSQPTTGRFAIDADTFVRSVLFLAVFPLMWISLHPFSSLADPPPPTSDGGDRLNQIFFGGMFLIFFVWMYFIQPNGLKPLLRPAFLIMIAWFALSVVLSWEPALSARRLIFAIIVLTLSSVALLLPKNLRHFSDMLSAATIIVLLLCYLGVVFIPENAIHQATDFLEPEHAGSWRGVFPHKNQAGSMMVVFFFIGLFVARVRSRGLGVLIAVAALIFLALTRSKTPIVLFPATMVIAAIVANVRRPFVGAAIAVSVSIVLNLLTVGSVYFEPIHQVLDTVMSDASFTGRTDIWKFALDHLAARPITGYGFGAFWGTDQIVFGPNESMNWATAATDAHNGYLNIAITTGLPGLLLAGIWIAVLPILDYYRRRDDEGSSAMATLFLRIVLFGIYTSSFEGSLFQQAGEFWFVLALAIFGLRFLSFARVKV